MINQHEIEVATADMEGDSSFSGLGWGCDDYGEDDDDNGGGDDGEDKDVRGGYRQMKTTTMARTMITMTAGMPMRRSRERRLGKRRAGR